MLRAHGVECDMVFIRAFTSYNMRKPSQKEYELLLSVIEERKPELIGVNYMTIFHREVVERITELIQEAGIRVPIIWGGQCATLYPGECIKRVPFVMRGEAEYSILEFVKAISGEIPFREVPGLVYRENGEVYENPIHPPFRNLDELPFPDVGNDNKFYIHHDRLVRHDPTLSATSYELIASRGCPYHCTFCCCRNLREIQAPNQPFYRRRSVDNVIAEIKRVVDMNPKIRMVKFWDDVFPTKREWIQNFAQRYKEEIGLPFQVWLYPLQIRPHIIEPLIEAGLNKVIMGIQSGSPYIRKKIFERPESQEDIIRASKILSKSGIPNIIYDIIIENPYETDETLKEGLELCMQLHPPYLLQLHGLTFFPGTALERMAIEDGVMTAEEMKEHQEKSLEAHYQHHYKWWFYSGKFKAKDTKEFWHILINLSQFKSCRPFVRFLKKRKIFRKNLYLIELLNLAVSSLLLAKKVWAKLKITLGPRRSVFVRPVESSSGSISS